ncbi:MAG TPA: putative Ig domain-containing protein [Steroidobacteraceae bacterium]|nr:putative Ig domain-containing protein [Steroidobacteraceae bacterium]
MRALKLLCGLGAISLILAGCGGGSGDAATAAATSSGQTTGSSSSSGGTSQASSTPPTISGTPATSVTAGSAYSFTPTASDPNGLTLTFSATNLPSWASINAQTGAVTGTPTSSAVGKSSSIVISVSNGAMSASLSAFSITVNAAVASNPPPATGSATVSWVAPTTNSDGSPLTNLAGYTIHYGNSATALNQTVQVASAGAVSYVLSNLASGTWYFAVSAYTSSGSSSSLSAVASKTI